MKKVFYYSYSVGEAGTEVGTGIVEIGIIEEDGKISGVFFRSRKDMPKHRDSLAVAETPLIKRTAAQLKEYFEHGRKDFDIPLLLWGTDFQLAVWKALQKIPYGETRSYKEVAAAAGNAKACRAAGMANNRNPIAIIIPCHRVIGNDGSLTGYGGGLDIKQHLLKLEQV